MRILALVLGIVVLCAAVAWLKLRGPDIPYADLEAKYANDGSRFVDLPGGFHVHYRDEGNPDGPLLLLLHGFGDSYTSWEGWVQELEPKFHIISLDFPGHGLTRAPQGYQLSGAGLADFVDAFATKLLLQKFAVAGNSIGGGAAWQLAVRHPERLDALILVDAAGFPNEKPPADVPLAFKILQYPVGRAILMDINFGAQSQATADLLASIKVPTLVLHGESDVLIEPASAHKFAAAIPGAKLITYNHVGHLPQVEIPQASAADVAAFLREARVGP